jgi:hypothetical protein
MPEFSPESDTFAKYKGILYFQQLSAEEYYLSLCSHAYHDAE